MSDYWKSVGKYWCKYCHTYVRDSALERRNHESTMTHQNGVKRALSDIHRGHEREEREKDRARQEVERLNRLVPGPGGSTAGATKSSGLQGRAGDAAWVDAERKRRLEELAGLGVSIPTEQRGEMAMAGEWTVTSTRVVEERAEGDVSGVAVGVRKREVTEEEREEEEAVGRLFKKRKGWGREVRGMPGKDDELEALLSGELEVGGRGGIKEESIKEEDVKDEGVKAEDIKREDVDEPSADKQDAEPTDNPVIKKEPEDDTGLAATDHPTKDTKEAEVAPAAPQAPVFKKRKAKNIRQK
ncbi:related to formin binding protein [Cephalotrichum gorgonifer]|uniref:Related to formin binding protein n=1 Tax=Cephalotrichum gorgonifer TaxID=2041049 RepID=A0AAE8N3E7_9PEZI|nr:related to formin binding protein [Cephalotrichum gorgonifer]